jgi:hypothetical protein
MFYRFSPPYSYSATYSQAAGIEGILRMWMMIENVLITQERWANSELSDSFCEKT